MAEFKKLKMQVDPSINDLIKKNAEEIINNEEVTSYLKDKNIVPTTDFVTKHLSTLLDLSDDLKICNGCLDPLKCPKERKYLVFDLKVNGDLLIRNFEYCSKYKIIDNIKRRFVFKDFPIEWVLKPISTIDISGYRTSILTSFYKIKRNPKASLNNVKWLYLKGLNNTGKSYFLANLANAYADFFKVDAGFVNAPKKFAELKELSITNKDEFAKQMEQLSQVEILVLDDFGNEFVSDYIRDNIVISILNERASNNLPTFISSSYSINEIETLYSTNKAGALRSKKMCELIKSYIDKEIEVTSAACY